jgi:hypothetical protein
VSFQFTHERHDAQVLGRTFQFIGQIAPIGRTMDYFNDENRRTFSLYNVETSPIAPGSPIAGITRPEITVSASELGLIYFLDPDYRQQVDVMRNADRVIAYTPHAVLRGNFHRGAETRLMDLFDVMSGSFLVMTDVSLFLLTGLPAPFPQEADLLIVNRSFVSHYHPE